MFIQDSLRKLRLISVGSFSRFLIMFILVVTVPLVLFVVGGYDPKILGQISMAWSFLAIGLLLLICVIGGFLMFRRTSKAGELSISQPAAPLKESDLNETGDHTQST